MTTAAARVAQLEDRVATRPAPVDPGPDPDPAATIMGLFRYNLIRFTGLARVEVNRRHTFGAQWSQLADPVVEWLNSELPNLPKPLVLLTPDELATGVDLFDRGQMFYTWHELGDGTKTGHDLWAISGAKNWGQVADVAGVLDLAIKAWAIQMGTPAPITLEDTAPILAQWVAGGGILWEG